MLQRVPKRVTGTVVTSPPTLLSPITLQRPSCPPLPLTSTFQRANSLSASQHVPAGTPPAPSLSRPRSNVPTVCLRSNTSLPVRPPRPPSSRPRSNAPTGRLRLNTSHPNGALPLCRPDHVLMRSQALSNSMSPTRTCTASPSSPSPSPPRFNVYPDKNGLPTLPKCVQTCSRALPVSTRPTSSEPAPPSSRPRCNTPATYTCISTSHTSPSLPLTFQRIRNFVQCT